MLGSVRKYRRHDFVSVLAPIGGRGLHYMEFGDTVALTRLRAAWKAGIALVELPSYFTPHRCIFPGRITQHKKKMNTTPSTLVDACGVAHLAYLIRGPLPFRIRRKYCVSPPAGCAARSAARSSRHTAPCLPLLISRKF